MKGFTLGFKSAQKQLFNEAGERVPVTVINTSPCYLIDVRMPEQNGYSAAVLGFGKAKSMTKSTNGQIKKAGIESPLRFLREIRLESSDLIEKDAKKGIRLGDTELFVGDILKSDVLFKINDSVQVTGVSKGKGFMGVVRRHNFKGGPRTHGQSDRERAPGSIGQSTTPGRVYKGKKMAGRMGNETVTIKNLKVVSVNENELVIKGVVPGTKKGLLTVILK
jgi:large subunit ribosomal protein L3